MKISSASKKVLASALSAAMVVAFAPAAALAAPADVTPAKYVTVSYDVNGGNGTTPAPAYAKLTQFDGKYYIAVDGTYSGAADGYSFSKWFIDADGDKVLGSDEKAEGMVDGENHYIEVSADATSVVLTAAYANPVVDEINENAFATATYDESGSYEDVTAEKIAFSVSNDGVAGHTYVLEAKNPAGTVVGSETFGTASGQSAVSELKGDHAVWFTDNALSGDSWASYKSNLTAGDYTFTLSDNGKVISTQKVTLCTVTVTVDNTTKDALAQKDATADLTEINAIAGTDYLAYLDADGYAVADPTSVTVSGDAAYTATKATQAAGAVVYNNGSLEFDINNAKADKYNVTVTDPSGATVYSAAYASYGKKTVSFDTTSGAGARMSAAESAGTYVVTVAATRDDKTAVSKAKMTLTELKVEAGEGAEVVKEYKANVKSYFTSDTTSSALSTFLSTTKTTVSSAIKASDDNASLKWKLNGAEIISSNKVKAGAANTLTAYADAVDYAAAPAYSVEEVSASSAVGTAQYLLSVTKADGTTVVVADDQDRAIASGSDGKYNVTDHNKVVITASATGKEDKVIELCKLDDNASAAWKAMTQGGKSKLEANVGNTTVKWLAVDGVKAAIESGKASIDALEAKYYATNEESSSVGLAALKALYEAVKAEADAQVAAYADEALVVAGSKAYAMDAATYKAAVKALAAAEKTVADAEKADTANAKAYADGVEALVTAANEQLKKATESKDYTAADIKAASDVTASLKAATDADSAKAAIEAYNALTDAQKKLVATADVTAAQKIVADAEAAKKLADEQDEKAVKYCNSTKTKTVKLAKKAKKTAKKFSVKWNSKVSESGNKVTYSKVSGAKITVSANGKATLKKGVKKGTYKAKVKVSCGNATRTVTAKFIVK